MRGYLASVGFSIDAGASAIGDVDCRETTCRFIANVGQVEILQRARAILQDDGFGFAFTIGTPESPGITVFVTEDPMKTDTP